MTEITDNIVRNAEGMIFFDAACGACSAGATRLQRLLGNRRFVFVPLQDTKAAELTHLSADELRREMKLRLRDGRVIGGVDALLYLARSVPWARPLAWLGSTKPVRPILHRAYARFARNRYRLSSACRIDRTPNNHSAWLGATALICTACALRPFLTPWIAMWTIAFAIYASLKLVTWWPLRSQATMRRSVAYLFACATLDAKRFLLSTDIPSPDKRADIRAMGNTIAGAILLWCLARMIPVDYPMLVAWAGMIGLVLMLHFGLLQFLSIAWQRAGIDAPLVMERPLSAVSLSDFWSRWNRPFTAFAFDNIFRPLRRFSTTVATLATFLFSGVVHDLAISVPAGAGFGRPTLYFLIQGAAILIERKLNLTGIYRRLFALVALVAPVALLFHPPFVHRVILPMMSAFHALGKELP